jgi:hypothetical protein
MEKQATFGNADLAKKMASRFGTSQKSVQVEMRYAKEVRLFIRKVEEAHQKAAGSKLIFG